MTLEVANAESEDEGSDENSSAGEDDEAEDMEEFQQSGLLDEVDPVRFFDKIIILYK